MKGGECVKKTKSPLTLLAISAVVLSLLLSCSHREGSFEKEALPFVPYDSAVPLAEGIQESEFKLADASGTLVSQNTDVTLDYSNTEDGYVMLRYTGHSSKVKTQITGPNSVTYTYNQSLSGDYDVYSLSEGSGMYRISLYENISGSSYSTAFSFHFTVALKDEFAPFLISNKYVNYSESSEAIIKSAELCSDKTGVLEKLKAIYEYVIENFSYDYSLAKTVKSGYIPDIDAVLEKKSGICFDYAAVMTAMLRCQGIPTKMVFGYTGTVYHAWISVYSDEEGWINSAIYFNGKEWKLMDPTFASTGNSSPEIMKYIGSGENYIAKYFY